MFRTKTAAGKHARRRPKKRFGQHFLRDETALAQIIAAADISPADTVLEIGAGLGALSVRIAQQNPRAFIALEKDRDLIAALKNKLNAFPHTAVVQDDILNIPLAPLAAENRLKIIGNLPYYITSPILTRLIDARACIDVIIVTVQKEVAQRIVAAPGTKAFGRLSCLIQYYTQPELLQIFPRRLFQPPPQVDSALVRLRILPRPSVAVRSETAFFSIIQAIFTHRRKTLLNSLLAYGGLGLNRAQSENILDHARIAPACRGEQLPLSDIARLSDCAAVPTV
ncbi:MAG: 16S rRNA (adenine(1518)-N(6)/adenine(1519)-N(6))-dimethyltransferase RsmA [Candidatus Omnitrophica bacterium]|nr:16S rRNA (adenine(1518)-N(6)/adenine(1519)-N(6))-dimethyltransferase RsmA [Candidatus Omnitrophota bacterium]